MTEVYLINNVNFPSDYTDVVDFETIEQQRSYFNSRKVLGYDVEAVNIRTNAESIRLKIPKIDVEKYSYLMFTNTSITGITKTYYAFIMNVTYVQPDITEVEFKVDVWQTYMFDYEIKDTFIDRQHEDRWLKSTILGNTIYTPKFNIQIENLEMGEQMEVKSRERIKDSNELQHVTSIKWFMVFASDKLGEFDQQVRINHFSNPMYVYLVPVVSELVTGSQAQLRTLSCLDSLGNNQYVHSHQIFNEILTKVQVLSIKPLMYCPFKYEVEEETASNLKISIYGTGMELRQTDGGNYIFLVVDYDENNEVNEVIKTFTFEYNPSLNKLSPKSIENETKLFTRPYRSYTIENQQLEPYLIDERLFNGKTLKVIQGIDVQNKIKVFIDNYLGDNGKLHFKDMVNIDEIALKTDAYKQYLQTQKATATTGMAVNAGMMVAGGLLMASGFGTYVGLGMILTGGSAVKNELIKQQNLKEMPDTLRSLGSNLFFSLQDDNFYLHFTKREIQEQYKQRIFEFLFRYGYKSNSFGIPNLRSRYYFNYIKTIKIEINSSLPNHIKEMIRNIYQNGTTLWHYRTDNTNPVLFDYTKENVEMSVM